MKVTVEYMAQMKSAAGVGSETVEVGPACTAHDLLTRLAERHGARFRDLLLDTAGTPHPSILVFVNDEQVRDGQAASLEEGAVVTLLSPMAGG